MEGWINKNVVYILYKRVLFSVKKEGNPVKGTMLNKLS